MREACYRCAAYIQADGYCHGDLGCDVPMEPIVDAEDDYDPQWTPRLIVAAVILAAWLAVAIFC